MQMNLKRGKGDLIKFELRHRFKIAFFQHIQFFFFENNLGVII